MKQSRRRPILWNLKSWHCASLRGGSFTKLLFCRHQRVNGHAVFFWGAVMVSICLMFLMCQNTARHLGNEKNTAPFYSAWRRWNLKRSMGQGFYLDSWAAKRIPGGKRKVRDDPTILLLPWHPSLLMYLVFFPLETIVQVPKIVPRYDW